MHLQKRKTLQSGFTLTEVAIALVITMILMSVVVPSYVESVRKSRRMEGRAALLRLMQQQERYYSLHNSYIRFSSSSTDEDERKFQWFSGGNAQASAYEIKAEACANDTIVNCVLLTAMPGTSKVDDKYKDPVCGELSLTSIGVKAANKPDCWK